MEGYESVVHHVESGILAGSQRVELAEVGRHRLMADMTVAVRESLRRPILDAERSLGDWAGFGGQPQEHHEAIYEAVVAGDGQWAADLVESHIRTAYAILRSFPPDGGSC